MATSHQLALTGLELKEQGQQSLERHGWVQDARDAAQTLIVHFGWVTSDLVHDVMGPPPHVNCYGSIWRDKRFVWTGEWVKSKRPEAHARMIRVWRLSSSE